MDESIRDLTHELGRSAPLLMGILNVTPDSFSDGGAFADVDPAVEHGLQMAKAGAAIIDIGGESTRPGSERIGRDQQLQRVIEPTRQLRAALDRQGFDAVTISIDTTRADVAERALYAGAGMLNDVSAGREDERMFALAAERGVPLVLMHMQGQPGTMQDAPVYADVVQDVLAFLRERAALAEKAGLSSDQIWIDPGIGFGKTLSHNLALLAALDRFVATGYPVLLGASRKRFIAQCMGQSAEQEPAATRLAGTLVAGLLGATAGVAALRVHDVAEHTQALAVLNAVQLNTSRTNK